MISFALTKYIFPISGTIQLFNEPKAVLTNLTNESDIRQFSLTLREHLRLPPDTENEYVTAAGIVEDFRTFFSSVQPKFYHEAKDPLEFLARNWVVVQFEHEIFQEQKNIKVSHAWFPDQRSLRPFRIVDERDPHIQAHKAVFRKTLLLVYLMHNFSSGSLPESFLVSGDPHYLHNIDTIDNQLFMVTMHNSYFASQEEQSKVADLKRNQDYFPTVKGRIQRLATQIELFAHDLDRLPVLNYILEQLVIATSFRLTANLQILTLVSIIEMLLTHNPDFSRFNVEDSIGKQFKLKLGVVASRGRSKFDYQEFEEKVKHIYRIRSMIAHGNFLDLREFLEKQAKILKIVEDQDAIFHISPVDIVMEMYIEETAKFLQKALYSYISNPSFVEYLKKS